MKLNSSVYSQKLPNSNLNTTKHGVYIFRDSTRWSPYSNIWRVNEKYIPVFRERHDILYVKKKSKTKYNIVYINDDISIFEKDCMENGFELIWF